MSEEAGGKARLLARVQGRVQRVGFRAFVVQEAQRLGLAGHVRNLPSGRAVEVDAEGDRVGLEELLRLLAKGPPGARVESVEEEWKSATGRRRGFNVDL